MELFQYTAGLDVTGVATVETQQLLFSDRAPAYIAPTPTPVPTATPTPAPGDVGAPQIGISPWIPSPAASTISTARRDG